MKLSKTKKQRTKKTKPLASRPILNNLRETETLTRKADKNLLKTLKELERDQRADQWN